MRTSYKNLNTGERITRKEAAETAKLINLYNQVHGTDYNMTSVGIQTIVCTHHGKELNNAHFAYLLRNGKPFNNLRANGGK